MIGAQSGPRISCAGMPSCMQSQPFDDSSGANVVAFTLCVVALMQVFVWVRERESGMPWIAAGSIGSAVIAARGIDVLPGAYLLRACLAIGLTGYLGEIGLRRWAWSAVLALPCLAGAALLMAGHPLAGSSAAAPLLWIDFGMSMACLLVARRERDADYLVLAAAPMIGPAGAALDFWRSPGPHLSQDFPASVIGFGMVVLVVGLLRRSEENRRAQTHAQRVSNFYGALSRANQAILRALDPSALFAEVCRICVDTGHAELACVYLDQGSAVKRAATAGPAAEMLAELADPWDITTTEARASCTVQVLRGGMRLVSHDYQADPRTRAWHAIAARHGVNAMAWLPLRRGGRTVAVLMLAALERGFFNDALMRLLDEMTDDISFALDNFDRKAAYEQSMHEVEAGLERFRRLFHAAPVGAAIISIDDRTIVEINDALCVRHGVAREQLIGRTTASLAYAADAQDRERFYQQLHREGQVRNLIMNMREANGTLHVELVNAEPLDYLGRACHLYMSLDITELKAAEQAREEMLRAQAANRAKTNFLSRISHELRTPLNAILGFSGLLQEQAAGRLVPAELVQLDHVRQAGWHLLALINDVLDVSRIEAGEFRVSVECLDAGVVLDGALEMVQSMADLRGVRLRADYRGEPRVWVLADATRLSQAVINVLTNATKYNRPGGSVRVRLEQAGGRAEISVMDDGLGMTPAQLEHLFEPFNRLGREREGIEGTGIGLTLTRQLLSLMEGDITVESSPQTGTCVRIQLPLGDQATTPPPAARRPPASNAEAPRGTVLYVEDNAVNSMLVEQLLSRWPEVRFVGADDAASGLRMVREMEPNLVLLDLQLPDQDGLDVLRELRSQAKLRSVPIVVLSASATPQDIQLARDEGATDYWTKPLHIERFLAEVSRLLGC